MNDDIVDIVMKIHEFNQDLTQLNIKYSETIEEQKKEIERLNNINDLQQKKIAELNSDKESIPLTYEELSYYFSRDEDLLIEQEKEIERLKGIIEKTIKYCKDSSLTLKSHYFIDVETLLKGGEIKDEN